MTEEDPAPPAADPPAEDADADRAARLAALLSVDISPRSAPSAGPRGDTEAGETEAGDTGTGATEVADTETGATEAGDEVDEVDARVGDDRAGGDTGAVGTEAGDAAGSVDTAESGPEAATDATSQPGGGRPWRRMLTGGVLVVLLVAGVGLAYAGTRIVRSSTQGEVLTPVDDPEAPGFEALVDPTPTMVVMHEVDGLIDSITVLTLPDPDGTGGGVLMVPARTVADVPLFEESPLEIAYDLGDPDLQAEAVGLLLEAAMHESTVVDAPRWAELVAPVAPLELDNPNELVVDGEVRFPPGEIELGPDDVGPYLEATVEGESDLARLFRHELFWNAWLDAVAADGSTEAVPGELRSGIARFVRTLAPGSTEVETLPVEPAAPGRFGDEPAFIPRFEQMDALLSRLVPFPVSPAEGVRARVRVLNGTNDTSAASVVAPQLPPAGVEVVMVGNAASLDVERTTVAYVGEEFRDEAEDVADILGVGRVQQDDRPSDAVDITVTLGADL